MSPFRKILAIARLRPFDRAGRLPITTLTLSEDLLAGLRRSKR